jgi:phosphoglycerate-specific signal transduction histidine kinase
MESKKLNDILISNKLAFEEELRDLKNRAREVEIRKNQAAAKSFEQRLKVLEEGKEAILRKNQELLRALQDKDRQLQDLQNEQNEEIAKYRQDNADLQQQVNHLTYLVGKLKSEIAEKDMMLGRTHNDNDHELLSLKQQLEIKKQENISQQGTIRDLRQTLKDSEGEWERRRRELIDRCNLLENDARKYKSEYERICEILKSKIN